MGMEARKIGGLLLTAVSSLTTGIVPIMLKAAPRWEVGGVTGALLVSTLVGVALTFLPPRPRRNRPSPHEPSGDASNVGVQGVAVQGRGHIVNVVHAAPIDLGVTSRETQSALDSVLSPETIEKLYRDYTAIQARHLAKVYDGKRMTVTGSIDDVRELEGGGVSLELQRLGRVGLVHCQFDPENSTDLEVLPKGYRVVVTGVLDLSRARVTLTDCKLESAIR